VREWNERSIIYLYDHLSPSNKRLTANWGG